MAYLDCIFANPVLSGNSENLNRFLEDLHNRNCQFCNFPEVLQDIQNAVEEVVYRLVKDISAKCRFSLARGTTILSRGSFYEGTKVDLPDEFDFLVELDALSQPGSVEFSNECPDCPGYVHLKIVDPEIKEVYQTLKKSAFQSALLPDQGYNDNFIARKLKRIMEKQHKDDSEWVADLLNPDKLSFYYFNCLKEAQREMSGDGNVPVLIQKPHGFLTFNPEIMTKPNESPNTVLLLAWTTTTTTAFPFYRDKPISLFPVTVDISPAILCYSSEQHQYTCTSGSGKKLHAVAAQNDNCKYGCKSNAFCWRLSFLAEETNKMKNLSATHKKVYRILKCVCRERHNGVRSLTSFILKTAVLHHSDTCDDKSSLGVCTLKIFAELITYSNRRHLPGYFFPEKNIWKKTSSDDILLPKPILQLIIKFFEFIAFSSSAEYKYEKFVPGLLLLKELFERVTYSGIKDNY